MEIAQFHLSNIKSGMFPSMAINMANGIPTREERRTIKLKKLFVFAPHMTSANNREGQIAGFAGENKPSLVEKRKLTLQNYPQDRSRTSC